jgi:hypothetical protein
VGEAGAVHRPRTAGSIEELVAGASTRTPVTTVDGKSGASFERVVIDGERYFLKVLSAENDWIMRCTGNTTNWEYRVWQAGLYHRVPAVIDHAVVAMAIEGNGPTARLAILMTDRSDDLVPPGDDVLPVEQHDRFIEHLATFHAGYLGWRDAIGLQRLEQRLLWFAPATIAAELRVDDVPAAIAAADVGWRRLPERSPPLDDLVRGVHAEPGPFAAALASSPQTFVAGDWKLGNLGSHADGRTIVLDWAYPGEAPPCWELVWYLALNRARMPRSKEDTIVDYRRELERHGVDAASWWERQLGLCMVGVMVTMAWEKALGDAEELAWWKRAALDGARWL